MKKLFYSVISFLSVFLAFPLSTLAQGVGAAALVGATFVAGALFPTILFYYINQGGSGCWFCPLYTAAFDVINTIATQIYNQLAPSFLTLMAALGAVWIAFIVLKYFLTLNVPNTGEFMTNLFKAIGRLVVGAAILMSSVAFLFNYTVNPVITFTGGLSSEILSSAGLSNGFVTEISRDGNRVSRTQTPLCTATDVNDSRFYTNDQQAKALSPEAYDSMLCMLKTMSLELIFGMAVSATIVVYAWTINNWLIFPNLYQALIGTIMGIGFFMLYFIFPFKLIDIIVRIGFVIALMPLYVLFWVFPVTRQYLTKGWDMLLAAMFTLVALSVLMVVAVRLITAAINIDALVTALASGNVEEATKAMSLSGTALFVVLASTIIAVKVINMAPALGSAFSGSTMSSSIGNSTYATTASAAKFIGKKGLQIAKAGTGAAGAGAVGGKVGAIPTPGSSGGNTQAASKGSGSPKQFAGSGNAGQSTPSKSGGTSASSGSSKA